MPVVGPVVGVNVLADGWRTKDPRPIIQSKDDEMYQLLVAALSTAVHCVFIAVTAALALSTWRESVDGSLSLRYGAPALAFLSCSVVWWLLQIYEMWARF